MPELPEVEALARLERREGVSRGRPYALAELACVERLCGTAERQAALESLTAIRRAGADLIITYYAKEAAGWLREDDPALFALVLRRLRLLMTDPAHPRARGATFRTKEGQSIHVVEVGQQPLQSRPRDAKAACGVALVAVAQLQHLIDGRARDHGEAGREGQSALLRRGIDHLRAVEKEMVNWMRDHEYESVEQLKGSMSHQRCPDPAAFERAQYVRGVSVHESP